MGRRLWWRLWGHSVARVQKVQRVHRVQRVVVAASPQFKKGGVVPLRFMATVRRHRINDILPSIFYRLSSIV